MSEKAWATYLRVSNNPSHNPALNEALTEFTFWQF